MIQEILEIPAADGLTEALLVRPESNDPLPAIINLTDGLGFRPAFAEQSKRIAERGYVRTACRSGASRSHRRCRVIPRRRIVHRHHRQPTPRPPTREGAALLRP